LSPAPVQPSSLDSVVSEADRLKVELDAADELLFAWGEYDGRARASLALALGIESPDVPLFEELLGEVRKLASSSSRANARISSSLASLLEHLGVEPRSRLELSPELALPHAQMLIEQELARRVALAVEAERERVRSCWAEALGRDGEPASEDELARFTRGLASEVF
jgi:hypothetical protein